MYIRQYQDNSPIFRSLDRLAKTHSVVLRDRGITPQGNIQSDPRCLEMFTYCLEITYYIQDTGYVQYSFSPWTICLYICFQTVRTIELFLKAHRFKTCLTSVKLLSWQVFRLKADTAALQVTDLHVHVSVNLKKKNTVLALGFRK